MNVSEREITKEGLEKLKTEYDELVTEKRQEIAQKIKEAKDFGDLSENAEYDEAKKEQAEIEAKIFKLESLIEKAIVIDPSKICVKKISVGALVTLYDYEYDEEVVYEIVGESESNPFENKLSSASPVGSAILGKKKGEEVEVEVPNGKVKYKIIKISRK